MSKERFDIANRISKKKLSFRSFIKLNTMKKSKKQFIEDLVAYSIVGIVACYIIACAISIIQIEFNL